jgi:2-oxo-4-hydroxy-4-carboxy-5-ureidoimidazoline decarboxylase
MPERSFKLLPGRLTRDEFLALYGGVYEHSPHFADTVFPLAASGALDTLSGLHAALRAAVEAGGTPAQLALIRAHPDLANRLRAAPLTAASAGEQSGAGLDQCTASELAEFTQLNGAYKTKFGFPFIKAVRGFTRAEILAEFRQRLANDLDSEFRAAMAEIHAIALLRLGDLAV